MDEDKVINKLIEHDEKLQHIGSDMATKDDMRNVLDTLDDIATIAKRIDQERIFTTEWVRRIQDEVEQHQTEITKLKEALNIA